MRSTALRAARYQLGRMLGYAFVGSLAGQLGSVIEGSFIVAVSPWLLSLSVAIALLWLAARLWRGASEPRIELRIGAGRRGAGEGGDHASLFSRLAVLVPREPAILGGLSVLLPCGALAAGLLLAAATGERLAGALLMTAFAVSSGLGVLSGGALLARLAGVRHRRVGRTLAISLALGAFLLGARPLIHSSADARSGGDTELPITHPTTQVAKPACH